ncbi:MAG TPA: autotransporter outer membrane beta-barrel domain-containing protein [Paraburkholderia sp.]|jgi:outer membrane autotransporter protein|nr:autotransporter outer membrane beta-barrel domain-containing protein [Paraburkholderia sp.]
MPLSVSVAAITGALFMWNSGNVEAAPCSVNQTTNSNSEVGCSASAGGAATVTVTGPLTITLSPGGAAADGVHSDTGASGATGSASATVTNATIVNNRTTHPSLGINVVAGPGPSSPGSATVTLSGTNSISAAAGGGAIANARGTGNATTTVTGSLAVNVTSTSTGQDEGVETTVRSGTATLDMSGVTGASTIGVLGGNAIFVDSLPSGAQPGGNVVIRGISNAVTANEDNSVWGAKASPAANAGIAAISFGAGTVNIEGTSASVNSTGPLADGIHALSQLGTVTVNNAGTIATHGPSSNGIEANTQNTSYDSTLLSYVGMPAVSGTAATGNVSVTNSGAITTSGGGSATTASNGILASTRSVGTGASGNVTVTNNAGGDITTQSDFSNAILATTTNTGGGAAGSIDVTNAARLNTSGAGGNGIATSVAGTTGGAVHIDNSGAVTSNLADGVLATTTGGGTTLSVTNANGGSISGTTGVDVDANFVAPQLSNAGTIRGTATDGVRVLSGGASIVNNAPTALIDGQQNGVNLPNGGAVTNTSGTIQGGSVGVLGSNGVVVNSSGTISGGVDAVQFASGNNSLDLNSNSVTIGNVMMGSGTDVATVHGGATIAGVPLFSSSGGLSTLIFNGYAGAARAITSLALVKVTNGANVGFSGADTHSAQLFQIDGGATLRFTTNTGTLEGNVTNAGTLDYSAGDAAYAITGTLANTGVVVLASASGVAGNILTVANYQGGVGASVKMGTLLNAGGPLANQFTDRLLVLGNATNSTQLLISTTGHGAPTPMDKIETASTGISVVQVAGASTQGAFVLGNNGVVGNEPFIYHLNAYGPTSSLGPSEPTQADSRGGGNHWDYRLQNSYIKPDGGVVLPDGDVEEPGGEVVLPDGEIEEPNGEVEPPGTGGPPDLEDARPRVAEQVPAYLTAPLALFQAGYLDISTLHQRLGEIRYDSYGGNGGSPDTTDTGPTKEVFARAYGGRFNYTTNIGFGQFGYNASIDAAALQFGGTLLRKEDGNGTWRYGLAASFGHVWWSPDAVDGNSSGDVDRYTFYGTATYQSHAGWYADGIVFGGLFDGSVSTGTLGRVSNMDGTTVGLSLESGYPFTLTQSGLSLEPQLQIVWQHLSFDSKTDVNGIVNELGSQDSALLRVGFRLAQPLQVQGKYPVTPYFKFNFLQPLNGGGSAVIGQTPFEVGKNGSSVQIGVGVTGQLKNRLSIYGDALYQRRVTSYGSNGWMANAGFRYTF